MGLSIPLVQRQHDAAYSAGPVRHEAVISRNNSDGPVVVEL